MTHTKPLQGLLVLDFSQYLSGPSASLRLADLGARVIKIEKPTQGDSCRSLYCSNLIMNEESSIFHAINRNKESYVADLKSRNNREKVYQLIAHADVIIHNFRPGIPEKLGIGYRQIKKINDKIIYGEITGYGKKGVWKNKAGLDLLIQSIAGITQLNGNENAGPVPIGLAVIDLITGAHLCQGILACLFRREKEKIGGLVEANMLSSAIDYQFESITCFFTDGGKPVIRPESNAAHAYLGAPYGVYETKDGAISLAMGSIAKIGSLIGCDALSSYQSSKSYFSERTEITKILADHFKTGTTKKWLDILEPADIWCAELMDWKTLLDSEAFRILEMIQDVSMSDGYTFKTTRCPISINNQWLTSNLGTPFLGEHTENIHKEFSIK